MRWFTYGENIFGVAVVLIVIAARYLHAEGACLDSLRANLPGIAKKIESGTVKIGEEISVKEADAAVKREGEELFQEVFQEVFQKVFQELFQEVFQKVFQELSLNYKNYAREDSGQCSCVGYTCSCCIHLEEPEFALNGSLCANVSYLVGDFGVALIVTYNRHIIFNRTVSARDPPAICFGVPLYKDMGSVCLHLHDIEATRARLHACVGVEFKLMLIVVFSKEIGCINLGPFKNAISNELYVNAQWQYPSVQMV